MTDRAMEAMIAGMESLNSEGRLKLLENIGELHGMSLTLFALLEAKEHEDHDCKLSYPKTTIDGYLEVFLKDVYGSIELTCDANSIVYAPDPNKKVRDEILKDL